MKNFKVTVTKWTQKFDLIRNRESESILKEDLHKEGFSIVTITQTDNIEVSWARFYFEVNQDWILKQWSIISNDIFKAFLKIKDELKWDLVYIYQNKDDLLEEKEKNMKNLNEQYKVYLEFHKKELLEKEVKEEKKQKIVKEEKTDSFWLKKELEKVYILIDKVLEKLKYFIQLDNEKVLSFSRKEKIKDIYNNIIRLKSSTNVSKLYQIAEIALAKIWEIELEFVEKQKNDEYRNLLNSTNKLLKEAWSKTQFIEKEKDIVYILSQFFNEFKEKIKKEKKEKIVVDTKSSLYLKNKVLYEKYENKYKLLQKEYYKNIFKFIIPNKKNNLYTENFDIKKQVIKNNLFILKNRLTWSNFSYVKLIKWYKYTSDLVLKLVLFLQKYFIYSFLVYTLFLSIFLLLNNLFWININVNIWFLLWIVIFNMWLFLIYLSRWIISLIVNFLIISLIFWIFIINF